MPLRTCLLRDLEALLRQSLRITAPCATLSPDEPLFGGRLPLDSVDALQWSLAVEQHYHCEISEREIAAGALETLGRMADVLLARGITSAEE
ncbi:MAG TPA: phosphopantetheine-binding protein [Polyangiaceae bacterium]